MLYSTVNMLDGSARKVSRLILGTAQFGSDLPTDDAFRIMDKYWEAGGNALDTARVYGAWLPDCNGASERTVGAWVRSRGVEKEAFVITKGAHPPLGDMRKARLSRKDIFYDAEQSMEALGLERIDLYFLHRDDENRPVSDIMESLNELSKSFPVKALGGSNWHVSRLKEAQEYAAQNGIPGFAASELRWSRVIHPKGVGDQTLVDMDEQEYAGYKDMNLAVMAYTSQGQGLFMKGYAPDFSDVSPKHKALVTPENVQRYNEVLAQCKAEGISPSKAVLRYITDDENINAFALVGCSKLAHIEDAIAAML